MAGPLLELCEQRLRLHEVAGCCDDWLNAPIQKGELPSTPTSPLPDSRPPPVDFSPPNAPPISAPEVPMLMLTIPQCEPSAVRKRSASR